MGEAVACISEVWTADLPDALRNGWLCVGTVSPAHGCLAMPGESTGPSLNLLVSCVWLEIEWGRVMPERLDGLS